jgi:hypothetical protein
MHATCATLAVAGVAAFGVATSLARSTHPSHAKHRAVALVAPQSFIDEVRQAQLDAGRVAMAQGPSEPVSGTS